MGGAEGVRDTVRAGRGVFGGFWVLLAGGAAGDVYNGDGGYEGARAAEAESCQGVREQ